MEREKPIYYQDNPNTKINTLLLSQQEAVEVEAAARRAGSVVIEDIAEEEAVAAYTEALQSKVAADKPEGIHRIEERIIAAAVARTLSEGGKVARIIITGKSGEADLLLRVFEDELVDLRAGRSSSKKRAS